MLRLVLLALPLALAGGLAAQKTSALIDEGKSAFRSKCVNCHFVPDQTIPRDQLWTQLIETTA